MWMPKQLEILDLSTYFTDNIKTLDLVPVEDFNSHFMPCLFVQTL
jgi:hypothetical protein